MDLEYGLKTLKNLDKAVLDKWYPFSKANERENDLLEVVKLRIELSGDFIISGDYKYFKKIKQFNRELYNSEIKVKIEWREDTGEMNEVERNLPDPKFKPYDKKKYAIALGRAD